MNMSKQALNDHLFPVRVTKTFRDELGKMAEEAGVSSSELVRYSIEIVLRKRSTLLHDMIEKWKAENDGSGK